MKVGTILRLRTDKKFRVWRVVGVYIGALGQESAYELKTMDIDENDNAPLIVPVAILETHNLIERIDP